MITVCPSCKLSYQIEQGHVGTSMTCQNCGSQFTIAAEPDPASQPFAPPPSQPQPPYSPGGPGAPAYGRAPGGGFTELIAKLAPKPLWVSVAGLASALLLVISLIVTLVKFGIELFLINFVGVCFLLFTIGALTLIYSSLIRQEELLKKLVDK